MTEIVTLSIAGQDFTSWKEVSIDACIKDAARSFSLKGALDLGSGSLAALMMPPAAVTISASGTLLFTGYIDRCRPKLSATHIGMSVSGRSKGADAIDCSCDHTKGDYVDKDLLAIAKDQDAFGIGFSADFDLTTIDRTRPNPGESLHDFLLAHIEDEMATMAGQDDGGIKLTRAGVNPPRQPGSIVEGVNFFEGEADHDWSGRHSDVHVHGQSHKGTGASATQITALSKDSEVTRYRPYHIIHPGHTDQARVQKRADNHRSASAGEGTRLPYRSSGWRDSTGAIWMPGAKIWTEAPSLVLVQDMLIERVSFQKNEKEGEYAQLDLVDPRAHGGQGGGVNKSGSGWASPQ